jgi:flagellar hook-length control protein FliK
MASIDAANDPRTSPADATRDIAVRATADARVQLASDDIVPRASDSPATTTAHDRGIDALTASLGVGAASPGADPAAATASAPAPALATPVDSPDFASALGVRVSVLVQDGVQQAELHLNPAETGPVSIHISLDGTAARVDFGADLASTRAAIERGLPELASALRDAGFTLAGGGVSQHAGGRASGDDDTGRSTARLDGGGNSTSTPVAADSRRVVRTVSAGGVDLYA